MQSYVYQLFIHYFARLRNGFAEKTLGRLAARFFVGFIV